MKQLKTAVIGTGYLGRFHAQKHQLIPELELIGVCDVNQETCHQVANELHVKAYTDYTKLFGHVDAVSIAATTRFHYQIAKDCLQQGIHVLLEKPITETIEEADELIALAQKKGAILQIGHLEQFNPVMVKVRPLIQNPLYIDAQRLAPYTPRGADVNVILDLMIHDIELIQSLVKSPIEKIEGIGAPAISSSIDIANARITFKSGCVANVTASRVSAKPHRQMKIYQRDRYYSIDFQLKQYAELTKGDGELFPGVNEIQKQTHVCENQDALLEETKAFSACILNQTRPIVDGMAGREALKTALEITALIEKNLERFNAY